MKLTFVKNSLGVLALLTTFAAPSFADEFAVINKSEEAKHSCEVRSNGDLYVWGINTHGQLGDPGPELSKAEKKRVVFGKNLQAAAVTVGDEHTCVLTTTGKVKCWGANRYGQLGIGASGLRGVATGQVGDNLPFVDLGPGEIAVAISSAFDTNCAALRSGGVKCWGRNDSFQLGLSHRKDVGLEPNDLGANLLRVESIGTQVVDQLKSRSTLHATCAHIAASNQWICWGDSKDAATLLKS